MHRHKINCAALLSTFLNKNLPLRRAKDQNINYSEPRKKFASNDFCGLTATPDQARLARLRTARKQNIAPPSTSIA